MSRGSALCRDYVHADGDRLLGERLPVGVEDYPAVVGPEGERGRKGHSELERLARFEDRTLLGRERSESYWENFDPGNGYGLFPAVADEELLPGGGSRRDRVE